MPERDPVGGGGTFISEDVEGLFRDELERNGITESDTVERLVEKFAREGQEGGFSANGDYIPPAIADILARLGLRG